MQKTVNYAVKSAYQNLVQDDSVVEGKIWKVIWNLTAHPRVKTFMWLVCKNRILTNNERARRGMADDASCGVCGAVNETIIHTLRDCRIAKDVWMLLVSPMVSRSFFILDLEEWLHHNLIDNNFRNIQGTGGGELFATVCWLLWKQRNGVIFNRQLDDATAVVSRAASMRACMMHMVEKQGPKSVALVREGSCQPPKTGWVKYNCDGAASSKDDWAAAAGVLRDHRGAWISGFQRFVDCISALVSELLAILHGMQLAFRQGYMNVVLESDCSVAIQMIKVCIEEGSGDAIVKEIA